MTANVSFPCYGAIPFRALRDRRLAGLPLALLGIIAAHDRFGRNGQGCWASQSRLAELLSVTRQAVCVALGILEELGYVVAAVDEKDRRRRTYSVTYDNAADTEAFTGRKRGASHRRDRGKTCPVDRTDIDPICPPDQTEIAAEMCPPDQTEIEAICPVGHNNFSGQKPQKTRINTGARGFSQQGEYIPLSGNISSKSACSASGDWGEEPAGPSGHVGKRATQQLLDQLNQQMAINRHQSKVRSSG